MGLVYEKEGHIAKVGLNRPEEKNALDPGILMELHRTWADVNQDEKMRVVILYSCMPDIFCAGMDLKTAVPVLTRARKPESDAERWLIQVGQQVGEAMLKPNIVKKPVIAAVNGFCLTGGFEMVMGADLRIASENAIFQMREASLGIMPIGGGNIYLPRIMTPCRALEVLLTSGNFRARTLCDWGFINHVVPSQDDLMKKAVELADKIAENGPLAVQGIIKCFRETRDMSYAENGPLAVQGIIKCFRETRDMSYADAFKREIEIGLPIFGSADAREGILAQKEKRKPNFPGKY